MKTELITFDEAIKLKGRKAIDFFSDKKNITHLIEFVREEATATVNDVETKKGREAIGSTALKISKSRSYLTDAIDASVSEMETKVKTAKAVSKYVIEKLNKVRNDILEPRKLWQAGQDLIEENRIKDIKEDINNILAIGTLIGSESKEEIASLVEAVESIDVSEGYEEFTADAAQAVKDVLKTLNDKVLSIIEVDRQAEQEALLAAEQKRSQITERLNKLAMTPMAFLNQSSSKIKEKIDKLRDYVVPEDEFGESYQQAIDSVKTVIKQLTSMHDQQIIIEDQIGTEEDITTPESRLSIAETMAQSAPTLANAITDQAITVTISQTEYQQLLSDSEFLGCLYNAGVDSWDGYDQAQSMMHDKI